LKSYSPDRLLSFIFICLFLWCTSLHAQENPAGCEPVGIIPHGANQIHTDITGGATLLGQTAIIRQGLTVYAYRLDASGQPILVGQMPLPLGGTPHFATNGETLSISLHSYEAVNGSGSSFSSPLSQRTVHKFSLQDLAPLEGFIDERNNNLVGSQPQITFPWIRVYRPGGYAWDNWYDDYLCSYNSTCSALGMQGRFYVSTGNTGFLMNGQEYTENYFFQNGETCWWPAGNCILSDGAMVAGGIRVADDTNTLFGLPHQKLGLPSIPELSQALQEIYPSHPGHSPMRDLIFHYYEDVSIDHESKFAVVGVRASIDEHVPDLHDVGIVTYLKFQTNQVLNVANSSVFYPLTGQQLGFSVAATGAGETVNDDTGELMMGFTSVAGGPGEGHASTVLPVNSCTTYSQATLPPTAGGVVVAAVHNPSNGQLIDSFLFYREEAGHKFGYDVAALGNLNYDLYPEVIAGAPGGNYVMLFSFSDENLNTAITIADPAVGFGKQVGAVQSENGSSFFMVASDDQVSIYDAATCFTETNRGNGGEINFWQPEPPTGCAGGGGALTEEEAQALLDGAHADAEGILASFGLGEGLESGIQLILMELLELLIGVLEDKIQQLISDGILNPQPVAAAFLGESPLQQLLVIQALKPQLEQQAQKLQKAEKKHLRSKKIKKKARKLRRAGKRAEARKLRKKAKNRKRRALSMTKQVAAEVVSILEPFKSSASH